MRKKYSTEQWLDKALKAINSEGFGRLKIDRLVQAMGVTKGSFYWHFKNRGDFVEQLIRYWDKKFTLSIIEYIKDSEGNGKGRLLELMLLVTRQQAAQYDFAIDALAQNEPEAFQLVKEVLQKRFAYAASLFEEMGFNGTEKELRSRATVMFMIQEQNSLHKESVQKQLKRIPLAHSLFTKQ